MTTLFTESAIAPVKVGNTWRAVLITPGKGSSGIYSESMLKEHGAKAFPKGTHSYVDHPVSEGEIRSPKNLMGVLAEDAHYEEGVGLVGNLHVMPHWKEFVEAVAPYTGLSIYAMGEGSRDDEGNIVVESLVPHTQNSVDLVSYAGRPGSGLAEKLYEAAVARVKEAEPGELVEKDLVKWTYDGDTVYGQVSYVMTSGVFPFEGDPLQIEATEENPVALMRVWDFDNGEWQPTQMLMGAPISALTKVSTLGESKRGTKGAAFMAETRNTTEEGISDMEIKELSEQIAGLPALIAAAVAEALAPAGDPEETEETVDVAAVSETVADAMVAANLPEVSRKAVYESLRNGANLNDSIEAQKSFVESIKSQLKETAAAVAVEETLVTHTEATKPSLRGILNMKVGN
jgi:hypothetical protein